MKVFRFKFLFKSKLKCRSPIFLPLHPASRLRWSNESATALEIGFTGVSMTFDASSFTFVAFFSLSRTVLRKNVKKSLFVMYEGIFGMFYSKFYGMNSFPCVWELGYFCSITSMRFWVYILFSGRSHQIRARHHPRHRFCSCRQIIRIRLASPLICFDW